MKCVTIITLLVLSGCRYEEFERNNQAAFEACIEAGGVPIQPWFNASVLGDCVWKRETRGE